MEELLDGWVEELVAGWVEEWVDGWVGKSIIGIKGNSAQYAAEQRKFVSVQEAQSSFSSSNSCQSDWEHPSTNQITPPLSRDSGFSREFEFHFGSGEGHPW